MTQENKLEEVVEIEFVGNLGDFATENLDYTQVADLDIMSGEDTIILKIKSPCTLVVFTSEWTEVYIQKEEKNQTTNTTETTYTLTKKELEAFVWAGWNMSGEGYNSEYYTGSNAELQITVEDTVGSVLIALTEETK